MEGQCVLARPIVASHKGIPLRSASIVGPTARLHHTCRALSIRLRTYHGFVNQPHTQSRPSASYGPCAIRTPSNYHRNIIQLSHRPSTLQLPSIHPSNRPSTVQFPSIHLSHRPSTVQFPSIHPSHRPSTVQFPSIHSSSDPPPIISRFPSL